MKTTVLIPVKTLSGAKSRLAGYLTNREREILVLEMLRHVLLTVKSAHADLHPFVVSSDAKVHNLASSLEIETFPEVITGHNQALTHAALHVDQSSPILTLSADLPLITPVNLENMIMLGQLHDVVLAPSKEQTGTNAIFLRAPLLLPYVFGTNSLKKFIATAEKQKLHYSLYQSSSLAFDIDTVKDLTETNFLQKFHLEILP